MRKNMHITSVFLKIARTMDTEGCNSWYCTLLKFLLYKLLKQPGQLYFVTELKFDLISIQNTKQGTIFIYGLSEGQSTNEKKKI